MDKPANKPESKYERTARRMDEALLELLAEKDFPFITVKEICARAGVNRSTFYLHYETIGDLLDEAIERMNSDFFMYFSEHSTFFARLHDFTSSELNLVTPKYLIPYLTYVKNNKRVFRTAFKQKKVLQTSETYARMFEHVFNPVLARLNVPEADRAYLVAFYVQGLIAIVAKWLESDCADSIEHVCQLMQQCVRVDSPSRADSPSNKQA